jgi:hypothetical protein
MVKVASRGIVLVLSLALLISSCKKESIQIINTKTEVVSQPKKVKAIKKKRKIKLLKNFRKKVVS